VFEGHTDDVEGCAFSPDGTLLATGSSDQTVQLWRVHARVERPHALWARGRTARVVELQVDEAATLRHPHRVEDCTFSADSTRLVTACSDRRVRLWDVSTGAELGHATLDGVAICCAAHPRQSDLFAAGDEAGRVYLLRVESVPRPH
jgi:WD40 repeat protein